MALWILEYVTSGMARRKGDEAVAASLAAEGLAMLQALLQAFAVEEPEATTPIQIAWDAACPIPESWEADPRFRLHLLDHDQQEQRWWQQAASDSRNGERSGVVIVAPESGGTLEQLSRSALRVGCRLLSVDPDFIALCADKTATQQRLAQHLVPVPSARFSCQDANRQATLSWIIKPRDGCGADQVQWWNRSTPPSVSDFPAESWHIEPFCPGRAVSIAVLSGPAGCLLLPPCRQDIDLPHDFTYRGGAYPLPEPDVHRVHQLARQVIGALPRTSGYFGIDLVLGNTPQDDVVVEVNPRVTTSIVALVRRLRPRLGRIWQEIAAGREVGLQVDPRPLKFSADGKVSEHGDAASLETRSPLPAVILGLDVGGANVKLASSQRKAASFPFPLWRDPAGLAPALHAQIASWSERFCEQPMAIALTMTGELADCYRTKREGVSSIIDAVREAAPQLPLWVYSTRGGFLSADQGRENPLEVAAANWHATAMWLSIEAGLEEGPFESALLVDMGSTTTDLIPIGLAGPIPLGMTDPGRLASGELVYTGLERTAVAAIVRRLRHRGQVHGVAAETFATALDAHLMLGNLVERPDDCETADGRPATREFARDRLARMIGGDRDLVDEQDAVDLAAQIAAAQRRQLLRSLRRVLRQMPRPPERVWVAGHGNAVLNALLREALPHTPIVELCQRLGTDLSRAAPAYAVARLALRDAAELASLRLVPPAIAGVG